MIAPSKKYSPFFLTLFSIKQQHKPLIKCQLLLHLSVRDRTGRARDHGGLKGTCSGKGISHVSDPEGGCPVESWMDLVLPDLLVFQDKMKI